MEKSKTNISTLSLYQSMKSAFDPSPVIAFAVRDGYLPDETAAIRAFDGLLQWLAGHAAEEHPDHPYVMMNGHVDDISHSFLLNTRTYLHFCRDHVGFFIHHTPITDGVMAEYDILAGIDYTVDFLQKTYGEELSPALRDWVIAFDQGDLTASSVSCVKNAPDRIAHDMIGVQDFHGFWDTNRQQRIGTA